MVEPAFNMQLRNKTPRPRAAAQDASRSQSTDTARASPDSDLDTTRHVLGEEPVPMSGGGNHGAGDGSDRGRKSRRGQDHSHHPSTSYHQPHPHYSASAFPQGQSFTSPYNAPIPQQSPFPYMTGYDGHLVHGYQSPVYPSLYQSPPPDSSSHSFPVIYSSSPTNNPVQSPPPAPASQAFQILRYSSPSTPQYPYPPQSYHQSYPHSPVYQQGRYAYVQGANYSQYSPSTDMENQMPWWYGQTSVSPRAYEPSTSPFHGPFPVSYSPSLPIGPDAFSHPRGPHEAQAAPSTLVPPLTPSTALPQSDGPSSSVTPERQLVRRPYHPNPPSHRSEWVMWVGNVPNDASHDELWRFFNCPTADGSPHSGVMSIFLISRSSCAFVNYDSQSTLEQAISQFNGIPLRPNDTRCPRLVCRVRQKDDDLKAGVGGQRGTGLHMKWIKEQKGKGKDVAEQSDASDAPTSPSTSSRQSALSSVPASDEDSPHRPTPQSSSSGSFGSTTSSVLTKYFPKRFFILKSLTQFDLDLSVQKGLWATQKHNEGILDQAYRTSKEVYLIFGVNKSGEFYGYAKMAGPVLGEHRVSWASRANSTTSPISPVTGRGPVQKDTIPEEGSSSVSQGKVFFPAIEHRLVGESPQPLTTSDRQHIPSSTAHVAPAQVQSAPPETAHGHNKITPQVPATKFSLDTRLYKPELPIAKSQPHLPDAFHLDERAPLRAMKHPEEASDGGEEQEQEQDQEQDQDQGQRPDGETWGESFRVEWLCTEKLPFFRTRHLRNPWNKDREVKVSRDGTELEPLVGQQLIDEWSKLAEVRPGAAPPSSGKGAGRRKQQQQT